MSVFSVLIVDDENDFREAVVRSLNVRGFASDAAASGEAAIEKVRVKDYDVIVLDLKMPGRDGVDTLKEIKRISPLAEVVLLTGHASVESSIDGIQSGAFDYLIKPLDFDVLLDKLHSAYERKQVCLERARIN